MEQKKTFIVNAAFYAVIAVLVWAACRYILPVLVPFILAFLIASLVRIPVKKLGRENRKVTKPASILLSIVLYVVLFLAVAAAGAKLIGSAGDLVEAAPGIYQEQIVPFLGEVSDRLETAAASFDDGIAQGIGDAFQNLTENIGTYISDFSVKAVKAVSSGIAGIPGFIVKLVIMVVSTFFILADYEAVTGFLVSLIPEKKRPLLAKSWDYVKHTLGIYVRSYTLLFLLTFAELTIGFLILRIPYAPILGLAVAVFDLLPVLGTGGILLPWAVVLLFMGNTALAAGLVALYLVITIIRNTLEPKIVGKQIGLHPLATLVAMFLGLKLAGVIGMIAFPVGLTVLMSFKREKSSQAGTEQPV